MSASASTRPMIEGSPSTSDQWRTPADLARMLGPFGIDPCSHARSHIEARAYCRPDHHDELFRDGLSLDWTPYGSAFLNWPYSNPLPWSEKVAAYQRPWVVLAKLDPTTRWWATLMSASPQIAPFRKRIKFEGDKAMTANFPSVLVYRGWAPSRELAEHLWIARWA